MIKKIVYFLSLILLFQSCYVVRSLTYFTAGIYDYKIFRNDTIKAKNPNVIPKSYLYNKKNVSSELFSLIERYRTTALVVIKDDSILFEKYWNEGGSEVISNSFSVSKSIVGLLVGFAIQDGYIKSVEQKVCDIIPDFEGGCKSEMRILDLLTMSSGIQWNESYFNPFGNTAKAYYGRNLYNQMIKLKTEQKPGFTYRYLSANTQLLGFILQKTTGKSLSQYTFEKLWQPLGAQHMALWSLDRKNGYEKAYCCFHATALDFAKIGMFVLHNGRWKGKQLLNPEYIKQSLTPAKHLSTRKGYTVDFYGYQWWILNYKDMKINMACGLYGQYIIIIPNKNLVIVRLGHKASTKFKGHFTSDVYTYIDAGLSLVE